MDCDLPTEKKKIELIETRWNRIEKRHNNSIKLGHRHDATKTICKNLIRNTNIIRDHHIKAMMGDELRQWCLDPNLVMDLRHSSIKKVNKKEESSLVKYKQPRNVVDEREQFHRMLELNREIEKFKESLENMRPKALKRNGTREIEEYKNVLIIFPHENMNGHIPLGLPIDMPLSLPMDMPLDGYELAPLNMFPRSPECEYGSILSIDSESVAFDSPNHSSRSNHLENALPDVNQPYNDDTCSSYVETISQKSDEAPDSNVSVQPESKPEKYDGNLELIITPTFRVDVQETRTRCTVNSSQSNTSTDINSNTVSTSDHKISLDQHMSILIKKLDINGCDQNINSGRHNNADVSAKNTERNIIINELFRKNPQDDFVILQKYFLRWVHYTTIEKLMRRNPEQTRLKKMEAFLQNITLERKRTLSKLRHSVYEKRDKEDAKKVLPHQNESPRLLARKYNNKIKIQQDIIELQKLKLQRQERVIAELKLSKLIEDTTDAESDLKSQLKFVARNGCQNSRSVARCLQIAGNLKDEEDDIKYNQLQANGLKAPKFLIEMQARALEREMKHQQAQERRDRLEKEREAMRVAAEDAKRVQDEQAKRERIQELRRKRLKEKELKAQKEMERIKYLGDLERAKSFDRARLLKMAMLKFRNLVDWKRRNENVSNKFRRRLLCRNIFKKWQNLVKSVWNERKTVAEQCYNRHCLVVGWTLWQKYYLIEHSKKLLADDWYDMKLSEKAFRAWNCFTAQRRMIFEIKIRQAEAHYNWCLKWRVLEHWRRLHAILQIERETETRRERWRNKIHELIPDYTPNALDYL